MKYEDFYAKVMKEARTRIKEKTGDWVPVCTNKISENFPDFEIAVVETIMETEYWDGPF